MNHPMPPFPPAGRWVWSWVFCKCPLAWSWIDWLWFFNVFHGFSTRIHIVLNMVKFIDQYNIWGQFVSFEGLLRDHFREPPKWQRDLGGFVDVSIAPRKKTCDLKRGSFWQFLADQSYCEIGSRISNPFYDLKEQSNSRKTVPQLWCWPWPNSALPCFWHLPSRNRTGADGCH